MNAKKLLSLVLALLMFLPMCVAGVTAAEAELPFTDVKKNWAYESIGYVYENGLMNGTGDGSTFSPQMNLSRAMVVTVLYRMEGSPRISFNDFFVDVEDRKYYSEAVTWAKTYDIVNATLIDDWGNEYFSPNRDITRQELATLFVRYAEYRHVKIASDTSLDSYKDASSVAKWATKAMKWANGAGLIKGTGSGDTLSPKGEATREQFAAIMHRFCEAEFDYELSYTEPKVISSYTEPDYPLVTDADVYVAVDGNDKNDGSFEKPLATFEGAKAKVRELKKTAKDEIKVAFMAGNYGSLDNLTFTADDSGSESVPITYLAYGDGDVVFQNGVVIPQSEFKPLDDSDRDLFKKDAQKYIYKADLKGKIDKFDFGTRLFSQNGVGVEARMPDNSFYYNMTTTVDDHASIRLQMALPSVVAKFSTYEGLKIGGFLRTGWMNDFFPVKSYDPEECLITFDFENAIGDYITKYPLDDYPLMYEGRTDDMIYFSNLPDFLDASGEYWFDNSTSTLYVYRAKGEYAIDGGKEFVTVEESAEYLSFVGMEFNATSASAFVVYADHFTMDMCTVGNVGGKAAVNFPQYVKYLTISNSEFYNCVDTCVYLFSECATNDVLPNVIALEHGHNVIVNNYFHDFTLPDYFSSAVEITADVGTYIAHNHFYEGAHGGIRYNQCIDMVIEYNVFDRIMTKTQDFGAVYTWTSTTTRDNSIRYNLFKNIPVYAIYLDDFSSGQNVYGNLFFECGFAVVQNCGRDNEIHDNALVNCAGGITSNPGRYSNITNGTADSFNVADDFISRNKPLPGDEHYDEWYARWPELYDFNVDPSKVGEPECLFTTLTYLSNNAAFDDPLHESEMLQKFAIGENNVNYSGSENPLFVNPSIGDYRIRDDADFFKIPFDKMGRY